MCIVFSHASLVCCCRVCSIKSAMREYEDADNVERRCCSCHKSMCCCVCSINSAVQVEVHLQCQVVLPCVNAELCCWLVGVYPEIYGHQQKINLVPIWRKKGPLEDGPLLHTVVSDNRNLAPPSGYG